MRRPACSGSQDNPGLFQEESPKKKERSVASRWTDNPAYLRGWRERALGTASSETGRCRSASEGERGWEGPAAALQRGAPHGPAQPLPGRQTEVPLAQMGDGDRSSLRSPQLQELQTLFRV